ncbi:hypothetical protein IFM89_032649 [Coptis chinensis]|uniref:Uncharacterized protein n=1 Tax=Coptis chinensis TaxID=261450 RepID=A0A835HP05_9MAGN|nr:hypothetical protein IFM89_032649 [Coptis chinensis]
MDKKEEPASSSVPRLELSCIKCFDALWFCYSPFHQMQQYYRAGVLDNCSGKWNALFDCLSLKTKPLSQVQEILQSRQKMKKHIWSFRTKEEASANWGKWFGNQHDME